MNDRQFLVWLHDRLECVHGENRNSDCMHRLLAIASAMPDCETPNVDSSFNDGGTCAKAGSAPSFTEETLLAPDEYRTVPDYERLITAGSPTLTDRMVIELDPVSTTRTWTPTTALRIARPIPCLQAFGGVNEDRLQQAWRCLETGETEWRDVEIVPIPREDY